MTTTQTRQYKDAGFLTTMVLILLLALTGLDLVTALFTWLEIDLYTKFQNGGFATQEEGIAAETASDSRMILVSMIRLGFLCCSGFVPFAGSPGPIATPKVWGHNLRSVRAGPWDIISSPF